MFLSPIGAGASWLWFPPPSGNFYFFLLTRALAYSPSAMFIKQVIRFLFCNVMSYLFVYPIHCLNRYLGLYAAAALSLLLYLDLKIRFTFRFKMYIKYFYILLQKTLLVLLQLILYLLFNTCHAFVYPTTYLFVCVLVLFSLY